MSSTAGYSNVDKNNVTVSLSRLALAKAIRMLDDDKIDASNNTDRNRNADDRPLWLKSAIFHQSHVAPEMLQRVVCGDKLQQREHILRHFGSKMLPQQHWQHPTNRKVTVPTKTTAQTIRRSSTPAAHNSSSGNSRSASSSTSSEESVPTTPSTPMPAPYLRHHSHSKTNSSSSGNSGTSGGSSSNAGSGKLAYPAAAVAAAEEENDDVDIKHEEKFRQRRHNSAPHHQHNRGTSGRDGDKYYDQHRDIQSNYQHRHRPSLQHHRSASLGDRRVEEVLHKPDHETSAPARQHPNYKQHYYINKSSSSKSPSAAPISTPPVHNQPPPSPSLRRTSSPLAVSENRHVKKPSSSSTPSHSNSNRPSPPAGYHNHHYPHHATQQQHPQQQQKSGAYVYNQSCTDARRRAEMLRAESTRSAYAATPPSPYVVPTHQRHLSNTAMSYPIVPVILMAPTPPPHGKSNSYTGIHGNDSGASWMMPTTVPANNFK